MNQIPTAIIALPTLAIPLAAQPPGAPAATNPPPVAATPPKEVLPPGPTPLTNSIDNLRPKITIVAPSPASAEKPERPSRPDVAPQAASGESLVERFQSARDELIAQQKKLSTMSRDTITEQQRLLWLEKRAALREEFRQRLLEIRNEFRNRELNDVLDAAKDAAKQTKRHVGED